MTTITIAIPTYNQARYLAEAIDSALGQSRPADEILVVDNGSTDDTPAIVARYPDVRYIRQTNQGICGSSNRCIQEARGDYLVILHSDDRLLPNHLAASERASAEHPEAAFVCGDYRWFGADDLWHQHQCTPNPDYYATLLRLNFIGPPLVIMFQRRVLERVGGFDAAYIGADDQELYLRIARQYPIHCHHEVIAEYRRHDAQGSKKTALMLRASMAMMRAQRPHIAGRPAYREAYRAGVCYRRRLYSEMLFWQGVQALRAGARLEALGCLTTVLRHDPHAVVAPVARRLFSLRPM